MKKAGSALKNVIWRAVCDPNDEVYKAWSEGLSAVYDKKWIAGAILAAFQEANIGTFMIISTMVALAFKLGVGLFCAKFAPKSIMIDVTDKKRLIFIVRNLLILPINNGQPDKVTFFIAYAIGLM